MPVPQQATLSPAFPNPFTARTRLTLTVPRRQHVRAAVYDVLGRRVATLFDGVVTAEGVQTIAVEAGNMPGGVYFVRVEGETFAETRRLVRVQ